MFEYISKTTLNGLACFSIFFMNALRDIVIEVIKKLLFHNNNIKSSECDVYHVKNKVNNEIITHLNSVKNGFNPLWFAQTGKAQTLIQSMSKFTTPPIEWYSYTYRREILTLDDGANIALDWKEDVHMNEMTPVLVCLHGLGGDSQTSYLKRFTDIAVNKGYRTVVYNRRGHGGMSLIPGSKLFPKHVNMDDMEAVTYHISCLFPIASKFLIGFSCGANLAVHYLTKYECEFVAGVSISNGFDIFNGTKLLAQDSVCDGIITQFLKDILLDGRLEEVMHLCEERGYVIDFDEVMKTTSLRKLEELLVVPVYQYKSLQEYYDDDSCHTIIDRVINPLLCISSTDDPFVHKNVLKVPIEAAKTNEHVIAIVTDKGGHIGWIEEWNQIPWYCKVVFEYFEYFLLREPENIKQKKSRSSIVRRGVESPANDAILSIPALCRDSILIASPVDI